MQATGKVENTQEIEAEADQAIAEREGDARQTVMDLLVANAYLEAARDRAIGLVSAGFIRSRSEDLRREGQ